MKTNKQRRGLTLAVWAAAVVAAFGQTPVITNLALVPRLTIHSPLGVTNQIQYTNRLSGSNWLVLTNLVVTQSPYWFVDVSAPPEAARFYRVVAFPLPPTNMALVPAGTFTMGDPFNDWPPEWAPNPEVPLHPVAVSGFYMDQYEVTKARWDEVAQWATNHGYSFLQAGRGKASNHPAQTMTWYDAVKWCNARSELEGRTPAYYTDEAQRTVYRTGSIDLENGWVKWDAGYRLPTEAEWEKAARGGASGHRFPWADADTLTHSRANYDSYWLEGHPAYPYDLNPTSGNHPTFDDGVAPFTSPVGFFAPNGYGLYDLAGNVSEWCWDWYDPSYYGYSSASDPRGPTSLFSRVHRGGGFSSFAIYCRIANRDFDWPDERRGSLGFRTVLPLGRR